MERQKFCLRTKGLIDNCVVLKEAIAKCRDMADTIDALAEAGAEITDDQGIDGYIYFEIDEESYQAANKKATNEHIKAFNDDPVIVDPGPEDGKYVISERCKWLVYKQGTLPNIATNLRAFADHLQKYKSSGLEIGQPSHGDYLYLYTDDPEIAKKVGMKRS